MAYKDFLSARDKTALEFYKLKYKYLSDEQKFDVKEGLKDAYALRNPKPSVKTAILKIKRISGF